MSDFYEAFEWEKASDIRHYGKKGMKWGVRMKYEGNSNTVRSAKVTNKDPDRANKEAVDYAQKYLDTWGFDEKTISELSTADEKKIGKMINDTKELYDKKYGPLADNGAKASEAVAQAVMASRIVMAGRNRKARNAGKVASIGSGMAFSTLFHSASHDDYLEHYGKKGMKWGVINAPSLKGGKSAGIVRGMQKTSDVKSMETWDLKDRVERMKAESDYRKLTEEEETYAVTQAEKIRKAKIEKVMAAVQTVGAVVGTVGGVVGLVKSISSTETGKKIGEKVGQGFDKARAGFDSFKARHNPKDPRWVTM